MTSLSRHTQLSRLLESLLAYSIIGYVLVFYLYPHIERDRNFFYIVVVPLAVLYGALNIRRFPRDNKLLLLSLGLITYLSAAAFWGPLETFSEYWKIAKRGLYIGLFFVAVWALVNRFRDSLRGLLQGFLIMTVLSAVISIGHYFITYNEYLRSVTFLLIPRMEPLLIPQALFSAVAYGLGAVSALYFYFTHPKTKSSWIYLLALLPLILIMLMTQSRGPLLGLGVVLLTMGFYPGVKKARWASLVLIMVLGALVALILTPAGDLLAQRGTSYRMDIWRVVLSQQEGHWLWGHGWWLEHTVEAAQTQFAHAHSVYVGTVRHAGLIGFLGVVVLAVWLLTSAYQSRSQAINLMGLWLTFALVYMMTDNNYLITRPGILWIAFWIPVIAICHAQGGQPHRAIDQQRRAEQTAAQP